MFGSTGFTQPVVGRDAATLILDEHVDEFCFVLALALRRILEIEPLDAEDEDVDEEYEIFAEEVDHEEIGADVDMRG
jgi:hypothetical protein